MNRSSFALFVALLVHLLLLLLFWVLGSITPEIKKSPPEEKKIKIALKNLPSTKPSGATKKKVKKTLEAPPMPKGSQLKKIEKIKPVKYKPKAPIKKAKLNPKPKPKKHITKPKPQPKVEPLPPEEPYIPLLTQPKEEKKQKKKDPLDWMHQDNSAQEEKKEHYKKEQRGASVGKNLKKLYGSEWGKLTPGQQKYMLNNQEVMRRITQEVLNRQARVSDINNLNVNKTNVIEFKLHPNGDMSDFRFLSKTGYYVLDDLTKATIGYAYAKYPRPAETILIRYNVFYNLRR